MPLYRAGREGEEQRLKIIPRRKKALVKRKKGGHAIPALIP